MAFSPKIARENRKREQLKSLWAERAGTANDLTTDAMIAAMATNFAHATDKEAEREFKKIKTALAGFHPVLIRALYAHGWRIDFARTPAEIDPDKAHTVLGHLDDDPYGRTKLQHISGMADYTDRHLYVTLFKECPRTGKLKRSKHSTDTLRHEVGHALALILYKDTDITMMRSSLFEAYWADVSEYGGYKKMKDNGFEYYTNSAGRPTRGYDEAFAEIAAEMLGGGVRKEGMSKIFPRFAALIQTHINDFIANDGELSAYKGDISCLFFGPMNKPLNQHNLSSTLSLVRQYLQRPYGTKFGQIDAYLKNFCKDAPKQHKSNKIPNEHTHDISNPRLLFYALLSRDMSHGKLHDPNSEILIRVADSFATTTKYCVDKSQLHTLAEDALTLMATGDRRAICAKTAPSLEESGFAPFVTHSEQGLYVLVLTYYMDEIKKCAKLVGGADIPPEVRELNAEKLLGLQKAAQGILQAGKDQLRQSGRGFSEEQQNAIADTLHILEEDHRVALDLARGIGQFKKTCYKGQIFEPVFKNISYTVLDFIGTQINAGKADVNLSQVILNLSALLYSGTASAPENLFGRNTENFVRNIEKIKAQLAALEDVQQNPHYKNIVSALTNLPDTVQRAYAERAMPPAAGTPQTKQRKFVVI
ncbi:MAG: hypothetical protein GC136_00050 [Alphaproteobacteria bacterium]|nr:hypothetical protein [Alphaproteobacteria bacterium]